MKIALLEDDLQQAELVMKWLHCDPLIQVSHFENVKLFLAGCRESAFDAAIMDWELPDQTGLEALVQLRNHEKHSFPVIFTTQRDSEEDIVAALNSGADDYLVKPLRQAELLARVNVARRRIGLTSGTEVLELGDIVINKNARSVTKAGEPIKVTQKDFDVAVHLLSNVGKVLSREYLLKAVWGVSANINTRTVDMHVSRVRRSLGITPEMGYCISTIYQHGYRLEKLTSDS